MTNTVKTNITFKIPYRELIKKNGLQTCLKIVPGTRTYLTKECVYGKR